MKSRTHRSVSQSPKLPSFVDLHLHGAFDCDFSQPQSSGQVFVALEKLYARGIQAFCPTLITSDAPLFRDALRFWGAFMTSIRKDARLSTGFAGLRSRGHEKKMSVPLGLHLEGPFLSPNKAGAHPGLFLEEPSLRLLKSYISDSQDNISILTLAPELKGAHKLISFAATKGIRVQLGHSSATTNEALKALAQGASGFTHLFNAMDFHHRTNAGLVGAFFYSIGKTAFLGKKSRLGISKTPKCSAEIICDTHHIDAFLALGLLSKFSPFLYPVSDACSLAGSPKSAGTLGSLKVYRHPLSQDLAFNDPGGKTLAGSTRLLCDHPKLLSKKLKVSHSEILQFFSNPKLLKTLLDLGSRSRF